MELKEPTSYSPNDIARFFHSFPHINLSFTPVSDAFAPQNSQYREALYLLAAVPVLWVLLWVLMYMIYFCCFCLPCRKHSQEKARNNRQPEKWLSFFFSVLSMMLLVCCLFGNEVVSDGAKTAQNDIAQVYADTDNIKYQSAVLLYNVDVLKNATVPFLTVAFERGPNLNETTRPLLLDQVRSLSASLEGASRLIRSSLQEPFVQMSAPLDYSLVSQYEPYRRLSTGVFCGYLILTLTLALCAIGCKKRRFILSCMVLTIFNAILLWVVVGGYVMASVGAGDFCVDPAAYIMKNTQASQSSGQSLITYYTQCPVGENPLNEVTVEINNQLLNSQKTLRVMLENADPQSAFVMQNISNAQTNVTAIVSQLLRFTALTECSDSHRSYVSAVDAVCRISLFGLAGVLAGLVVAGILILIVVFLYHGAARQSVSRRAYFEVDSQDNFQSRDQRNQSDNPLYYRFSQISTSEQDNARVAAANKPAAPAAPNRSSPPPAYAAANPSEFYSTYGNNGTLDSNNRVSNDLNRNSNTFRS